jgi:hypothetical protein
VKYDGHGTRYSKISASILAKSRLELSDIAKIASKFYEFLLNPFGTLYGSC